MMETAGIMQTHVRKSGPFDQLRAGYGAPGFVVGMSQRKRMR